MSSRRAMARLGVLALVSASGIVGMLVMESPIGDGLLLVLAALPLGYGGWRLIRPDKGSASPR